MLRRTVDNHHVNASMSRLSIRPAYFCAYVCKRIITSLQVPAMVEMQLNKLAESTAVVVHHSPRVAERLQQRIHLRNVDIP